jgi:hypothetical protein
MRRVGRLRMVYQKDLGPNGVAIARSMRECVVNLLLMGILLDSIFQWLILGVSHPGAALIVGPG